MYNAAFPKISRQETSGMSAKKRSAGKAPAKPSSKARMAIKKHAPAAARKSVRASAATKRSMPANKTAVAAKRTAAKTARAQKPAVAAPATSVRPAAPALAQNRKSAPRILPPPRGVTGRRNDSRPITSSVGLIHGIAPYQPKPGETYMNDRQLEHFRQILLAWKRELMEEVDRTVHHMQDEASNFPDPNDRATQESEFGLELRTRDRERKLLKKIDSALERIDTGNYGYCEETGEAIGLRRLEARPVATLSVEAQERREVAERQFRDREDGY
jgi:DnaK suppressor protein